MNKKYLNFLKLLLSKKIRIKQNLFFFDFLTKHIKIKEKIESKRERMTQN